MNRNKSCDQEPLTLYHYGELTGPALQKLESHLRQCPFCQQDFKDLQLGLAAVPNPKLDFTDAQRHRFTGKVAERIEKGPPRRGVIWGGALVAAAMVAAIMLLRPADLPVPKVPEQPAMADFEILEQLELLQELELLRDLDLLQEMEQLG